ncbi:hypothetical protein SPHINGOAX6_30124 [Sphingomonas sp. AX6]|nr:hypothetical protein SPHINGOAX6_30124 [Sphingomonas sp. AX6]
MGAFETTHLWGFQEVVPHGTKMGTQIIPKFRFYATEIGRDPKGCFFAIVAISCRSGPDPIADAAKTYIPCGCYRLN